MTSCDVLGYKAHSVILKTHPKLSNVIKLSSQTENYVKILGYKTHQKIESYQKNVMSLRIIGMRTLFVNVNKNEEVTH